MCKYREPARQLSGSLNLLKGSNQVDPSTVVDPAASLGCGNRQADRQIVLPTPGGSRSTTFSLQSRKWSSCRLSIRSRLIEGWKGKSKDSCVFTEGSREERMAACRRRLLRKLICADTSRLIASVSARRPTSISARIASTASREPRVALSSSKRQALIRSSRSCVG